MIATDSEQTTVERLTTKATLAIMEHMVTAKCSLRTMFLEQICQIAAQSIAIEMENAAATAESSLDSAMCLIHRQAADIKMLTDENKALRKLIR